jgi:MFS family permease
MDNRLPHDGARMQGAATLAAVCFAALSMPVSFTGPAVALSALGRALGGSPLALAWVTNAFMLAFGSCLMIAGALADRIGRRRVFLFGTALFVAASLGAMAAPGLVALDLLRAVQGVASAAAFASGAAALAQEFEGAARTRAFSLLGTTFGIGLACGPVATGVLVERFGWRAVFVAVAVLGVAAHASGRHWMQETRDPHADRFDRYGALSFTIALSLFTYAVLLVPEYGWHSAQVWGLLAGASFVAIAFVATELRVRRPMLDLALFRYTRFVGVQVLAAAPAYAFVVLLILLPLRFVGIEGRSTIEAGQLMFALSAPMLVVPLAAGWFARWLSAGVISGAGLAICAVGQMMLARVAPGQSTVSLVVALAVIGFGISLPWGLMDGLAVSVVPKERAGMAAGIFNTTRVAGEGVALAIVGAVLAQRLLAHLGNLPLAGANRAHIVAAAARLTIGDLTHAAGLLPQVGAAALVHAYGLAFAQLLEGLAVVTTCSAVAIFAFLGRVRPAEPDAVAAHEPATDVCKAKAGVPLTAGR